MAKTADKPEKNLDINKILPLPEGKGKFPGAIDDNPVEKMLSDRVFFRFKEFATTFVRMIMNQKTNTPFTIAIDGEWGTGKTTLMKVTRDMLDEMNEQILLHGNNKFLEQYRPCKTVWFNAWKYSDEDPVLAALLKEIFREMIRDSTFLEKAKLGFSGKDAVINAINGLAGIIKCNIDVSEFFDQFRIEKNQAFFDEFIDLFRKLIKAFTSRNDDNEKGVLVIFIDDLDRCPPGKVTKVLEAVKLFLDIEGCFFILGMDFEYVKNCINAEYKELKLNSLEYLQKMIQIHFHVPDLDDEAIQPYVKQFLEQLEISELNDVFLAGLKKNPRAVKRALNDFYIMHTLVRTLNEEKNIKEKKISDEALAKWVLLEHLDDRFIKMIKQEGPDLLSAVESMAVSGSFNKKIGGKSFKITSEILEDTENAENNEVKIFLEKLNDIYKQFPELKHRGKIFNLLRTGNLCFDKSEAIKELIYLSRMVVSKSEESKLQDDENFIENVRSGKIKDLPWANLQGAFLERANMPGANLEGAILIEAILIEANLEGACLEGAYLQGADLLMANLRRARLQGADLRRARLPGANMRRANMRRANMRRADLLGAILNEADLEGANLNEANLRRADLRGANLQGAFLERANLIKANLQEANLQGARLGGARLGGVDLEGANLRMANLRGASFDRSILSALNWKDAIFDEGIKEQFERLEKKEDEGP